MSDIFAQLAALPPKKRELLLRQLKQRTAQATGLKSQTIHARKDYSGPLPLSFAQQRLWMLDQLEPGNPAYNLAQALRLEGPLNVPALEKSFNEILRRHESLRTSFPTQEGQPMQAIADALTITLPIVDLRHFPVDERQPTALQMAAEEGLRPFDLAQGPLLRAVLLRLDEQEHVLVLVMHHIISDAWSTGIVIAELTALYEAFSASKESPLSEMPIQYADFTLWQREWLQGSELESQLSYWKEHLVGAPSTLQLPVDHQALSNRSYRGATQYFELPANLTVALKELSQNERATLFMTLLAAFDVLLYRYTQSEDIIVGSPAANRSPVEAEGLIGFFVNTLVLRTDLSGNPTFRQLLARVREVAIGAFMHQSIPFEKLVEELKPQHNLANALTPQVVFVLQNVPLPPLKLSDLRASLIEIENPTAKFDLTLNLAEGEQGLTGLVEYKTDLFEAETIRRMIEHFKVLLEGIVTNPDQAISRLPILTKAEWDEFTAADEVVPSHRRETTLFELFEAQVERTPDAVALTFQGERLTYREINCRANQLSHYLRQRGVTQEVLVGIHMQRSIEMVVAILGVLKAGGAYVPFDPAYPKERRAFMVEDSRIKVLLTHQQMSEDLPQNAFEIVRLDSDWALIANESTANLPGETMPDATAYVIYTSGSTGKPKGVPVSHSNVIRLFEETNSWFHFDERDVWTLFHSYAFDFSVWELWGALLYGGRLVVVPHLTSRSPEAFYDLLASEQVTVLNQTPSAFRQLIRAEEEVGSKSLALRFVIFGGEALELQSLRPWFYRHGDSQPQLVNMYGITETTVHVTYRPLSIGDLTTASGSVIGCPIPDLQIYLLDEFLQPVPANVPGQIYVAGLGLARGYLNRPELTADRFIPNPFGHRSGDRLYKTGDLARRLASGELEYLGRIDHQVKIRGYRIEMGEIEAVLDQHPAVQESVVLAREDSPGDKRLVAYLIEKRGSLLSLDQLREFLKERVPDYMVPSAFIILDKFPLTVNGKVDRRTLPPPDAQRYEAAHYVAPRNEAESILANVWEKVLGVAPVGIHDDFFALGGDSIRAIQIIHEARKFNLHITAMDIFQRTSISDLARSMVAGNREEFPKAALDLINVSDEASGLPLDEIEDLYPLSKMQELMLYHYSNDHQKMGVYHAQEWFHIYVESFSSDALKRALAILVHKHPSLRTVFLRRPGRRNLQAVKKRMELKLLEEDLSGLSVEAQEAYIDRAIREDRADLFDIDNLNEPLFRFRVLKRSAHAIQFFTTIHHGISDGWGNVEFLKELFELYLAIRNGGQAPEETAPNVFKEFLALEQEILSSREASEFWSDHLKNNSHKPLQRKVPGASNSPGCKFALALDPSLTSGLRAVAQDLSISLKTIFLTAYLNLIGQKVQSETATAGVVTNGRTERLSDPFKALGLFWNLIPLCCRVDFNDPASQLKEVQRLLIQVERFATYPLTQILADQRRDELFFATFNFLHFHNNQEVLPDTGIKILSEDGHDKFHFPMNYAVSVDPFDKRVDLSVQYDRYYFTHDSMKAMIDCYIDNLNFLLRARKAD